MLFNFKVQQFVLFIYAGYVNKLIKFLGDIKEKLQPMCLNVYKVAPIDHQCV